MSAKYEGLWNRRLTKGDGGFTLIELLIVIVVLGILGAIVVFSLGGVTDQSAQAACNADAKTVEVAVGVYNGENGGYPTAATELISGSNAALHTWPNNPTRYHVWIADKTLASGASESDFVGASSSGQPTSATATVFPDAITQGDVYVQPTTGTDAGDISLYDTQSENGGPSGTADGCDAVS